MYRILESNSEKVVGLRVNGKLTKEDYDGLIPYLEDILAQFDQISLLCDMSGFVGIEAQAFWEDFKFSLRHLRDFKRMAIVGDQRWLEWWTNVFNPLVKTDVKYFPLEHMNEAWTWVKS